MSKISTYEVAPVPKLADKLIGTSVGGEIEDVTYNFTLQELLQVFLPVIPANNLQGVLDYGNTATQDINLFGTITTTNLDVTDTATILDSFLTGDTHITGALYDRLDSKGTAGQVLRSTGTKIEWYTVPTVIPTLQQVLTSGNTSDISIILSSNIQALTATANNVVSNTSLSVNGVLRDKDALAGTAGQVLSSTGTKVQWVALPVYSATSPLLFNSATGVFSIQQATSSQNGYLSSSDWITFDGKQNAGNYITALTGEVTASGPGSVAATVSNAAVIGKVLTGFNPTAGTINASDTILTAFGKTQSQINALVGGVQYQGVWNANTNTPTLVSSVGTQGHYYVVNVAGNTNLNGISDWQVGDWAIFSESVWQKVDNTESVSSVNGFTGAVSLTTDNIPEGSTNLYFLNSRARLALSATSPLGYNNTTGVFSIQQASGSQNGYLSSTDWTTFNSKQDYLNGTGLVKSTAGTITYITDNSANWNTAYNDSITSAAITGTGTKTLTLTQQDAGTITASWTDLGLTSVGVSMPSAFNVANSPLTSNGTIAITGAGVASQYIRGDGTLATLPTGGGGGGGGVSYYLNGSINQGTIGGVTYYEMNKVPVIGTGTDFSRSTNGYIASFLTDINDPALLQIPAGNWNFETYFNASFGGGSPNFYIELYKYDGVVFTLIASNSATPKLINDGASIEAYYSALAVPQTALTLTDRLAVRIYVNTSGRTITLHTENSHLCQVITTFTTGITAINGLTAQVQNLTTGTSGTDFNINSLVDTHTFNLPVASATNTGKLSSTDWNTFNSKQPAGSYVPTSRTLTINGVTYDLSADRTWSITAGVSSVTATSPLFSSGGSNPDITIQQASGSQNGYLSSTDWTTFNNKQAAGNYITSLTGEATGTGPGATAVTLNNASVTAKVLTGINITGGTVQATDTMLTAFGKLQNQINGLIGSTIYQGTWNASTNTPALASGVGVRGYYYIVSVAGTTNLDGITDWFVGDWAIFDGTAWQQVDNTDSVTSVNGFTGAVSLTTDNISEGTTNLYFLNSRARTAISLTTTGTSGAATYNNTTGVFNIPNYSTDLSGYVPYTGATGAVNLGAFDLTVNGLTIGKGGNAVSTNTAIGNAALFSNTTGNQNVAVGASSFQVNTSGVKNTGVGYGSGIVNTTGQENTGVGWGAISSVVSGSQNTAVGASSLQFATGNLNTAIGYYSGGQVSSGLNNTLLGMYAGSGITTGSYNTIIGGFSLSAFSSTLASNVIIADGQGNIRFQWDGSNIKLDGNTVGSNAYTSTPYVPTSRTLSINGVTYDLSADRSWTVTPNINATTTQDYTATAGQVTFTVSAGYTVGQLAVFYNGSKLASNEFTATNGTTFTLATACQVNDIVQAVSSVTGGGIGGTGTINTIPKFTTSGTIGDSAITDNGTTVSLVSRALSGTSAVFSSTAQASAYRLTGMTAGSGALYWSSDRVTLANYNVGGTVSFEVNGGTEAMRITSGGNVGIGTSIPNALLQVSGSAIIGSGTISNGTTFGGGGQVNRLKVESGNYTCLEINGSTSGGSIQFTYGSNLPNQVAGLIGYNYASGAANEFVLSNALSGAMIFATNNTERMRITSGGLVGIGTSSPSSLLQLNGSISNTGDSATFTIKQTSTSYNNGIYIERAGERNGYYMYIGGAADALTFRRNYFGTQSDVMSFTRDGYVVSLGVYNLTGAASANVCVNSNGDIFRATSSIKYKKDISNYTKGLNEVLQLRPVSYKSKAEMDGENVFAGLIAEEVHDLGLTEFVQYAKDGSPDALSYSNMVSLLIKSIQEQQAQIEELKLLINK